MAITNVKLGDLVQAYHEWLGKPARQIPFRREALADSVPTELEVLIFQPGNKDQLPESKQFAYIATAGMSTRTLAGPYERVELVLRVDGKHSDDDLDALAHILARFALVPFMEHVQLGPGRVFCDIKWPIFVEMNCALITHWAVQSDKWLTTSEPLAVLLNVIPLHEAEAEVVTRVGDLEANARFLHEGINWHDPHRPIASLRETASPTTSEDANTTVAVTEEFPVDQIWTEIERWYSQHAPEELEKLGSPASEDDIAGLEKLISVTLPEDFKTSLRRHNGGGYIHNYDYLSTSAVGRAWTEMSGLKAAGKFGNAKLDESLDTFQHTWWHVAWVPVGEHMSGSMICLDLAPTEKGVVGQVLQHETQYEGPIPTKYRSFGEWLDAYKNDLSDGRYGLDEYGNFGPM